jgi:anti-sigma factor RsiW
MDEKMLERLMMDDALGALGPDASALLAAYTKTLPDSEAKLAEWRRVSALARQTMPAENMESIPPLAANFQNALNPWRIARVGGSIAAMLAIGMAIGSHFPQARTTSPLPTQQTSQVVPPPAHTGGVTDFWSSRRMVASALEQKHPSHSAWKWNSPLNDSQVGGIR